MLTICFLSSVYVFTAYQLFLLCIFSLDSLSQYTNLNTIFRYMKYLLSLLMHQITS